MSKKRRPVYKKVKQVKPHCPVCGMMLLGDNSISIPWRCLCGVWRNTGKSPFDYEVENDQRE